MRVHPSPASRAFAVCAAALFTLAAVLPAGALALQPGTAHVSQRSVSDYVRPGKDPVSRGEFLAWSVNALDLRRTHDCTLEYPRVPRGAVGTLCAVQPLGVLGLFGDDLLLSHPVTRGEALQIITLLTGKQSNADISQFRDIRSAAQERAVKNAVAHRWMNPLRPTLFGLTRTLSGTEALTFLQAVAGETQQRNMRMPPSPTSVPVPGTATVRVQSMPEAELLQSIWQIIQKDFLHAEGLDPRNAGYNTIEGLVESLDDPYSSFFRPTEADNFHTQIKGELTGIGAHVEDKGGTITIVAPLPGSPAENAGLQPGDEVLEADGNSLVGIGVDNAVSFIRGERGTTAVLKIRRNGVERTVSIVRDLIVIPEIEVTWSGDVAIVKILQFGETTNTKVRDYFEEIAAKNPRGIVLDLRNNPGGLLNAADVLASNFLPEGSVVAQVKGRESTSEELTRGKPTVSPDVKMAVLVNGGSASASEIVAGALQDHGRAVLVGTTTFGKGTVQELLTFRTGEALKLTIAEWLTPKGRKIDGVGLTPDIVVDHPDLQIQRALGAVR